MVESPFREVTTAVIDYVKHLRRESPRDLVSVFVPEYVITHWWESPLHKQSALRLKARLLFVPGFISVRVPLLLASDQIDPAVVTVAGEEPLPPEPSGGSGAPGLHP